MKQIKKITIGCLLSMPIIANAQFNFTGFPINTYARTNVPMQKVAIGNFPTNASVQAKFHVSQFELAPNPATDGFLFRTDGSNAETNSWSMFTGATAATTLQRFRIAVPANSANTIMEVTGNGAMQFRTNSEQRMHIDGNVAPAIQGFVGIGTNFTTPQSRLHIHERDPFPPVNGGTATYIQVTNQTTTNADANQGLRMGIDFAGTVEIRQQENLPMIFFTNNQSTARFVPNTATTLLGNPGMMGIGDFTANPNPIDAKLDIDGDLRIRTVTQDNTLTQILAIDPTDQNRVHWIDGNNLGGNVTADNGLSINPANNVQLGNDVGLTTAQLLNDREIPMNDNNIYFTNFSANNIKNSIGLGTLNPQGKLHISMGGNLSNLPSCLYLDQTSSNASGSFGLRMFVNGINTQNIGQQIIVQNGIDVNSGINCTAIGGIQTQGGTFGAVNASTQNTGIGATSFGGTHSYGVNANAGGASVINVGVSSRASAGSGNNYGILAIAENGVLNYGIYASVSGASSGTTPPSGPNYAGYFAGDVYISGTFGPSDIILKDNLNEISNASNIINQLQPKTFEYKQADFPTMNLSQGLQYGLIAQDVETILPELITNVTQPAEFDSLGNVITPEINFKGLEYQQLIPILIAAMKEQQQKINDLISNVDELKNCLNNANICTEGNRTMNTELDNNTNYKSVELTNVNSIILDQNSPNPFAENTIINYNIPSEVMEAKLMFYDLNGRIIKELIIEERGESKLTVYGTNLKTGVYTYSLIADGELIATKKMVKK